MLVGIALFLLAQGNGNPALAELMGGQAITIAEQGSMDDLTFDSMADRILEEGDPADNRDEAHGLQCCNTGGACRVFAACPENAVPVACPCEPW